MIDAKLIRSEPDRVREALARRGAGELVDAFLELDGERRRLQAAVEDGRAANNAAAKAIAEAKQKGEDTSIPIARQAQLKAEQATDEGALGEITERIRKLMLRMPNLPDLTAADGMSEDDSVTISTYGQKPDFGFEPKDHLELAGPDGLGLIDIEAAAKVSGSRFHYLLGDLVRLELAMVQWGMAKLTGKGFLPVVPPVLVREPAMEGTGMFPEAREQAYAVEQDDLFLVGTAEVPLASLHAGAILEEAQLPLRYVGFSPCFRREAGAAGKDTRGIFRVHQFDKLEMFVFCLPDQSQQDPRPAARDRGGDRPGAGVPLPGAEHPDGRPRRRRRQEVRHRGLAARPAALPGADVLLQHHRLPVAAARHPLPLRVGGRGTCTR